MKSVGIPTLRNVLCCNNFFEVRGRTPMPTEAEHSLDDADGVLDLAAYRGLGAVLPALLFIDNTTMAIAAAGEEPHAALRLPAPCYHFPSAIPSQPRLVVNPRGSNRWRDQINCAKDLPANYFDFARLRQPHTVWSGR
jgi:hypothetical protein